MEIREELIIRRSHSFAVPHVSERCYVKVTRTYTVDGNRTHFNYQPESKSCHTWGK